MLIPSTIPTADDVWSGVRPLPLSLAQSPRRRELGLVCRHPGPEALSEAPPTAYNSWAGVSPWLHSWLWHRQTCFASSASSSLSSLWPRPANPAVSVSIQKNRDKLNFSVCVRAPIYFSKYLLRSPFNQINVKKREYLSTNKWLW